MGFKLSPDNQKSLFASFQTTSRKFVIYEGSLDKLYPINLCIFSKQAYKSCFRNDIKKIPILCHYKTLITNFKGQ